MKKAASNKRPRTEGSGDRPVEKRISHATNHPVRLDALSIFFERAASPKEIAQLLRQPLTTATFHVSVLREVEAVELVKTEKRRGTTEHFYRARIQPEVDAEEWQALPKAARRTIASLALQAIVAEGLASLRHGRMEDDDDLYLAWMPMRLDAAGNAEVTALQAEMLARLHDIKARNKTRTGESESTDPVKVAAMLWFERANPAVRQQRVHPPSASLKK